MRAASPKGFGGYRAKKSGAQADRPTLAGGRGAVGERCCGGGAAGCRGAFPNPKKSRIEGMPD
jgi:hypothetical protein